MLYPLSHLKGVYPFFQSGPVFNCSSGFSTSGACGVEYVNSGSQAFGTTFSGAVLSGDSLILLPSSSEEQGSTVIYQTLVNEQAFTSNFTFIGNGRNVVWILENTNNNPGYDGNRFVGGAGCEAGFYQNFQTNPNNNILGIELDSYSPLTNGGSFTYSSAQIYQSNQDPCVPPYRQPTTKLSTSPVALNSPANSQGTTTGDTYSATVTYDGTTLSLSLFDVTLGGSCPGSSCFTKSWSAINIPAIVNGNTSYVGITGGAGTSVSTFPLEIETFSYAVNTPPSSPAVSTYTSNANSGGTATAQPVFSPAAGSYSGSQSVTISSSTSGSYICYTLLATTPSVFPQTNNFGGCNQGTLYTGPLTVPSTQTLYAMAGVGTISTQGTTLPSNLAVGAYTIGGTPTATAPVFSPTAGTYIGPQTVTATNPSSAPTGCVTTDGTTPVTNGGTGCTNGTLFSSSISVPVSETVKMVWGGTGFLDSSVTSAAYTITANPPSTLSGAIITPGVTLQ